MFDTVIKYNVLTKRQINLFSKSFIDEEFVMNPSAKEDSYSVLNSCNKDTIKNEFVRQTVDDMDAGLLKMAEDVYKIKVLEHTGTCILKYIKDKHVGIHRDWQEDDDWVKKNNKPPVHLSSVLYINDNYLGGEICFYDDPIKKNKLLEFKPPAGSVIFFDALQAHGTNPVVSGVKYCYTNFYTLDIKKDMI